MIIEDKLRTTVGTEGPGAAAPQPKEGRRQINRDERNGGDRTAFTQSRQGAKTQRIGNPGTKEEEHNENTVCVWWPQSDFGRSWMYGRCEKDGSLRASPRRLSSFTARRTPPLPLPLSRGGRRQRPGTTSYGVELPQRADFRNKMSNRKNGVTGKSRLGCSLRLEHPSLGRCWRLPPVRG
jgi:hypothetical protein